MEIRDLEKELFPHNKHGNRQPKFNFDKMWLGVVLGILAPLITMYVYYLIHFSHINIPKFIAHLYKAQIQSSFLSLCVVSNLLVFFIFIWSEKYLSARGVLLSTFIYGGAVVYLKFIQ